MGGKERHENDGIKKLVDVIDPFNCDVDPTIAVHALNPVAANEVVKFATMPTIACFAGRPNRKIVCVVSAAVKATGAGGACRSTTV